jgi:hypothetical protein
VVCCFVLFCFGVFFLHPFCSFWVIHVLANSLVPGLFVYFGVLGLWVLMMANSFQCARLWSTCFSGTDTVRR